jgi:hypothetical protein
VASLIYIITTTIHETVWAEPKEDRDKVGRRELTARMRCHSMKYGMHGKGLDEGEKHHAARDLDGSLNWEKHHRCSHLTA